MCILFGISSHFTEREMHYPGENTYEVILAQFKKNIGVTQGASQCTVDGRKLTAPAARESGWGQLKLSRVLATGCSHTPSGHPSDTGWSHGCPTQELILLTVQVLFFFLFFFRFFFFFFQVLLIEAPWVSLVFCLFVCLFLPTPFIMWDIPQSEIEPMPLHWEHRALITGLTRKSWVSLFSQQPICGIPVMTSSSASSPSAMHSPEQEANLAALSTWFHHSTTFIRISATSSIRELHL